MLISSELFEDWWDDVALIWFCTICINIFSKSFSLSLGSTADALGDEIGMHDGFEDAVRARREELILLWIGSGFDATGSGFMIGDGFSMFWVCDDWILVDAFSHFLVD